MRSLVVLAIASMLGAAALAASATTSCANGCAPWGVNTTLCVKNKDPAVSSPIKLLFEVQQSVENSVNATLANSSIWSSNVSTSVSFGFCPNVDVLQAFGLFGAATQAAGTPNQTITTMTNQSYIFLYAPAPGLSPYDTDADTSAMLFQRNNPSCPTNAPHALVTFLALNITMTGGKYYYPSTGSVAANVGFQPTCTEYGACIMGGGASAGSVCIGGRPSRQNCAKCVGTWNDIVNQTITVWTSYTGNDANGRVLQSGSSSPLAFQQYSATPIFNTVAEQVDQKISNI